jgi:hypothetical protein
MAAQERLYQLEQTPGILGILITFITSYGSVPNPLRLAAAIRFKRITMDNWPLSAEDAHMAGRKFVNIPEEDRAMVRGALIQSVILPETFKPIVNQLIDALFVIFRCDKDEHIDLFASQSLAALQATGASAVNGAEVQLALFKVLRFAVGSLTHKRYDVLCAPVYATLLPTLGALLSEEFPSEQAGRYAEKLLKMLHHSVQSYVAAPLRAEATMDTLVQMLCGFATRAIPAEDREEAAASAEASEGDHVELKTRKWSVRILNALVSSTVPNPKTFPAASRKSYGLWIKNWVARYGTAAATVACTVIEGHTSGETPMSDRTWHYALRILRECVKHAAVYKAVIKPNMGAIVLNGIIRALATSRSELDEWTHDPASFVVQTSSTVIFRDTHRDAARKLLDDLVGTRTKTALALVMDLVQNILSQYEAAPAAELALAKDGALAALATLNRYLSTPDFNAQTARLIEHHVTLDFAAGAVHPPMLIVRGLNLVASTIELKYDRGFLHQTVQAAISALDSSDRSLQLEASHALSKLTRVRSVLRALKPNVGTLLDRILTIMGTVVSETLGIVLRRLLDRFTVELVPHALRTVQQLVELSQTAFGVIAQSQARFDEQQESALGGNNDDDFDDDDNESVAALRTAAHYIDSMATIVDALDDHPETLAQVEPLIMPVIEHVFATENSELLGETMRLVQAMTYAGVAVSPAMWTFYPRVIEALHSDWACYSLEECVPALVNYATANGGAEFFQVSDRMTMLLSVVEKYVANEHDGEGSAQRAAILLRTLLGNCSSGQVAHLYPQLLELCLTAVEKSGGEAYLRMLALDCICALCYNDPVCFLTALEQTGLTVRCFNAWFSLVEHMKASSVLEYPMLAMASLVRTVPLTQLPASVLPMAPVFVGKMIEMLMQMYRAEIETSRSEGAGKKRGVFDDVDSDCDVDDNEFDGEDGDEVDAAAAAAAEGLDGQAAMQAKLEALAGTAAAAGVLGREFEVYEIPFKSDMDRVNVFAQYVEAIQTWVERDGAAFPDIAAGVVDQEGAVVPLMNYATKRAAEMQAELEGDGEEGDEQGVEEDEDEDGLEEDYDGDDD